MEFRQGTEKELGIMLRKMTVHKKDFTAFLKFCLELVFLTSKYMLVNYEICCRANVVALHCLYMENMIES